MKEDLRAFVARLEKAGELSRVSKQVDARYVSPLVAQSDKALFFERIKGYGLPLVSGIIGTRKRIASALDVESLEIGKKLQAGIDRPIKPELVSSAPVQDVVKMGDEVDLSCFPIPLLHEKDGAPYISGGIVSAKDPFYGGNLGMYRLMYRTRNSTGIDLVSPSDLRIYYQRALNEKRPLEIAVAVGVHPIEMLAASFKAPTGMEEYAIAGGIHGCPVQVVKCKTVDLYVCADAEIVLEGELLPVGWTEDEGRFGEGSHLQGDLKWNPVFKIKAITHRRDAIFYALHMPEESDFLMGPVTEAGAWRALREASVDAVAVRATPGSCCYWEVVASIRKRPGEGKNALLALLSISEVKLAIVTDEDIDIFNPDEIDWALSLRVQADKDVIIIPGARGKHLDPSVRSWELTKGGLPTTAKMGIDATIPEGIPKEMYERVKFPFIDSVKIGNYLD